jgi:hypothetical protein
MLTLKRPLPRETVMAKRNKAVQALEGSAAIAETQAIIRKLIEDEDLREAVGRAIESSRHVYDRVSGTKKASKLLEDKKLQAEALDALDAIRTVTVRLTGLGKSLPSPKARKKRKRVGIGAKALLVAGAGGGALALSEGLRGKVLDALFGAEEEFEYTPPPPASSSDTPGGSGSTLSAV